MEHQRRKTIVAGFLDTILNDIFRGIDAAVETEELQKCLPVDCHFSNPALKELLVRKDTDFLTKDWKTRFMQSIKDEDGRAKVYKDKDGSCFASNPHLAQAVSDGLALSTLANAKRTLWLRDMSIGVWKMGGAAEEMMTIDYYYNMQRAYAKLLTRQRKELKAAEEAAAGEGSDSAAAQRLKELALEALMMASLNGHVEAMRVLIENGALIDAAANVRIHSNATTHARSQTLIHTHAHTGLRTHNIV